MEFISFAIPFAALVFLTVIVGGLMNYYMDQRGFAFNPYFTYGTSFLLYPYLCGGARTGASDFDGNALLRRCNRVKNTQKQKSRRLYRRSGGGSRHRSCFSLNYQHLVDGHAQAGHDVYV